MPEEKVTVGNAELSREMELALPANEDEYQEDNKTSACTSVQVESREAHDELRKNDHFSIFGEYVASRLRRLTNPRLQAIGQHRISNVIFEVEMTAELESSAFAQRTGTSFSANDIAAGS